MDFEEKLKALGYNKIWMDYGFLSKEELNQQFDDYKTAVDYPESKEADYYGYQHTEHLRHGAFLKILKNRKEISDLHLEQLIQIVKCDKDAIMAENVYTYLVEREIVNSQQIEKYDELRKIVKKN